MKKIVFTSFVCFITALGYAQVTLETKNFYISSDFSYPVILPTVDNMIKIANMEVYTFKKTMEKYHYHQDQIEIGPSYVYTNENIDFYLYGNEGKGINFIMFDPHAGNSKYAGFRVFNKHAFPSTCIPDLYQQLAPYHTKTSDGVRYYAFEHHGYNYGVSVIPLSDYSGIVVKMYRFDK